MPPPPPPPPGAAAAEEDEEVPPPSAPPSPPPEDEQEMWGDGENMLGDSGDIVGQDLRLRNLGSGLEDFFRRRELELSGMTDQEGEPPPAPDMDEAPIPTAEELFGPASERAGAWAAPPELTAAMPDQDGSEFGGEHGAGAVMYMEDDAAPAQIPEENAAAADPEPLPALADLQPPQFPEDEPVDLFAMSRPGSKASQPGRLPTRGSSSSAMSEPQPVNRKGRLNLATHGSDSGEVVLSSLRVPSGLEATPPCSPMTAHGGTNPEDWYCAEEQTAETKFQRAALAQLILWDEYIDGIFTAKQAFYVMKYLLAHRDELLEEVADRGKPEKPWWRRVSCAELAVVLGFSVIFFWLAVVVAATVSRELTTSQTGVLLAASDGEPTAAASVVALHSIADLQRLPLTTLRRISFCTFIHKQAVHHLHVASLLRTSEGDVRISGPDRSTLRIEGKLGEDADARVSLTRPFFGEEVVDLEEKTAAAAQASVGCGFKTMAAS
eukprot:gnl/TRDRNA2_/TRDRNA2_193878_c0_seq1.p1 gnl/TRDRNA2_/TRDRNA2_193878_c0~~gnl/TRDRNA2_/TRDRNA2_193878_c0_seq1.p1  ORF type:complete len:546 (-),score=138.47 gnl/TRDRNA2_/TRDRNA2_193878_c0_seq1:114-1595(-)